MGRGGMKILSRYLAADFTVTFVLSLSIVTFILSIGYVFKIIAVVVQGVPWQPVVLIMLASIPTSLKVSVPMSALFSCLLLFGRLSADGEITAMRACGVKLRDATRTMLLVTGLLVAGSLYVNHFIEPRCHHVRRSTLNDLGALSAMALVEEGKFHSFEGFTLYVGKRRGARLQDVRIYDLRDPEFRREIRAEAGTLIEPDSPSDLLLDLEDVRIDPFSRENPVPGHTGKLRMRLHNVRWHRKYRPDEEDMTFAEVFVQLLNLRMAFPDLSEEDLDTERMALQYELSKRTSLALSPIALILVGMPLGIRSQRKESSVGIALGLAIVFLYYLLIILAESISSRPELHPDLIIWFPTALFLGIGCFMLSRIN